MLRARMAARSQTSRRASQAGLTLLETAVLVCVVGVILAVFVPTFVRHIRTSKIAEASEQLASLHRSAASYWNARHTVADGARLTHCIPAQAGPAPEHPAVDPIEVDFASEDTPGHETWEDLGFRPDQRVRYSYTFDPSKSGCELGATPGVPLLTIAAEGDLDGDGKLSRFERRADVSNGGDLVPVGVLYVTDRVE